MLVAARMLQEGTAYKCYCTQEELEARLGTNAAEGAGYVMYDKKCRNRDQLSETLRQDQGERGYALKFLTHKQK